MFNFFDLADLVIFTKTKVWNDFCDMLEIISIKFERFMYHSNPNYHFCTFEIFQIQNHSPLRYRNIRNILGYIRKSYFKVDIRNVNFAFFAICILIVLWVITYNYQIFQELKMAKYKGCFFDVLLTFLSLCLPDRKCFIHSHKWILWENDSDDIE